MEYGVIMAGGAGTRLWPLSRSNMPKQLLPVVRGKSLLQLSYERLRALLPADRIYVCTSAQHREQVLANLPEMPPGNLFGEPTGRDTANAVGFPAAILHRMDKDAVMAIVTADHVIEPIAAFQQALRTAFEVVAEDPSALVTFGIVPTHGHTGLGYIHRGEALALKSGAGGAYKVMAFKEKPDKPTADRYVESGRYYWNSGMFVWRADTVMRELSLHLPEAYTGLEKIADSWGTPDQDKVLNETYGKLPRISIDYAVMEPASQHKGKAQVTTVEMPVQWLDVGSWPALAETLSIDAEDNATDCKLSVLVDSDNNILISQDPEHLMTTIGLSDMIVVATKDVTMVCPKSEAQRVKELVGKVKERYGNRFLYASPPTFMRTLAVDFGSKRIGLAISDAGGIFATPLEVLTLTADQAIEHIAALIEREDVARLVVGLPLNMNDSIGPQARATVAWAKKLGQRAGLPVVFVDERLSSFTAEEQLSERRRSGEKLTHQRKKEQRDALAAAAILQPLLDGKIAPIDVE